MNYLIIEIFLKRLMFEKEGISFKCQIKITQNNANCGSVNLFSNQK